MSHKLGPKVRRKALLDREVYLRDLLLRNYCSDHYREHFVRAMQALYNLGYDVPYYERSPGKL